MNTVVRTKIRNRMATDLRESAKAHADELEHYGDCFSTIEKSKIKKLIDTSNALADRLDPP